MNYLVEEREIIVRCKKRNGRCYSPIATKIIIHYSEYEIHISVFLSISSTLKIDYRVNKLKELFIYNKNLIFMHI